MYTKRSKSLRAVIVVSLLTVTLATPSYAASSRNREDSESFFSRFFQAVRELIVDTREFVANSVIVVPTGDQPPPKP